MEGTVTRKDTEEAMEQAEEIMDATMDALGADTSENLSDSCSVIIPT